MKRLLQGSPIVAGPEVVESYREVTSESTVLTMSHDGYRKQFGFVHRRVLTVAADGSRVDGEDTLAKDPGSAFRGSMDDYAIRLHLHPSVKVNRLSDGRGAMLVLPNRDVWTFEAPDQKIDLEDSVFLAGSDGPRRTTQIVIHQHARQVATVYWSFAKSTNSAAATAKRDPRREPELPL